MPSMVSERTHRMTIHQSTSQAALARALGLSKATVTKCKQLGMPVDSVDAARNWRLQHIRPSLQPSRAQQAGPGAPPAAVRTNADDYLRAKTQREQAEAQIAELKLGQLAGSLIRLADVLRVAHDTGRQLRDQLMSSCQRLAPQAAATSTVSECAAILQREHRQVLAALVKSFSRLVPVEELAGLQFADR